MFMDWYNKKYVGEVGDFLDDPDFFGCGEVKPTPNDDPLMAPPIGSKEFDDWMDKKI